jgi:hypothetical protein
MTRSERDERTPVPATSEADESLAPSRPERRISLSFDVFAVTATWRS